MLQQILKDMYIDPEVLEALNEDQKKTLFLKMRQEQVRRWQEREDKLESDGVYAGKQTKPKKANGKSVSWLLGRDGDVAVIVIGEMDELSSRFICSGLEKRAPLTAQNHTRSNQSILATRSVEPNRTERDGSPSVTPGLLLNKDTSTLPPLSVSVREHSSPPAAEKSELKPVVVEAEETSMAHASMCPRPLVRANAVIVRPASASVTPGSLLSRTTAPASKPLSPTCTATPEPAKTSKAPTAQESHKSQEASASKDVAPSRVTVRSASEDALSSGNGPACAGRGRVAQLMKAFSTEGSAGPPQSPGQTPTRGSKPPLPTKPSHLRATAAPSVR